MRWFCAAESRDRGEAIFGTVALARSWLLLEYPGAWRRNAVRDSRLIPEHIKDYVARAADRCLLIRQRSACSGPLTCFFVEACDGDARIDRAAVESYDQLPEVSARDPVAGPVYAVCTHGRHDKCCAKFGLPVFCELRDRVGERAWQCSHVGGDRFAGNVVVFPYGLYYGRVTPDDIPELLRHSEAGQVWLPGYRGRSGVSRPVQVAEYFARRESGLLNISEFQPVRTRSLDTDAFRVELKARTGRYTVEFRTVRDAFRSKLTCAAEAESGIAQYELIRYAVTDSM